MCSNIYPIKPGMILTFGLPAQSDGIEKCNILDSFFELSQSEFMVLDLRIGPLWSHSNEKGSLQFNYCSVQISNKSVNISWIYVTWNYLINKFPKHNRYHYELKNEYSLDQVNFSCFFASSSWLSLYRATTRVVQRSFKSTWVDIKQAWHCLNFTIF